ncbi:hypothetical protein ANCCEY_14361 [Ancylostoma ceylanicum]|uniref:DDE Tnp4 domain-containing protein n=1 Tax=Ancylostoma ceylanicum TaxID=53326 RepID=A0A0D6L6Q7_9BILA|nr:hypothetical protein ANCCEY_14361 [Ancylostoma ceylanicum]
MDLLLKDEALPKHLRTVIAMLLEDRKLLESVLNCDRELFEEVNLLRKENWELKDSLISSQRTPQNVSFPPCTDPRYSTPAPASVEDSDTERERCDRPIKKGGGKNILNLILSTNAEIISRAPRRFHERVNPLDEEDYERFWGRFRFSPSGFRYILGLVGDDLAPQTTRSRSLTAAQKLAIFLDTIGSGGVQVFRESRIHQEFMSGQKTGILLADSGYRAENFILKPILRENRTPAEERFTTAQCRDRAIVERASGSLKKQFSSLHSELRYSPQRCGKIIVAACALGNLAIILKEEEFPDDPDDPVDGVESDEDDALYEEPDTAAGVSLQQRIIISLFCNVT